MAPGRKKKEPSVEPLPTQTPAPSRRTRTQRKELEAADPSSVSPLLSLSDQKKTRVRKAPVKKGSPLKNAVEPQSSPEAASSALELMPQLPLMEDEDASPEPSREYTEEYIPQSNHTNEDLTSNLMDLLDAKSSSTNPSQETFQEPGAESFASASGFGHRNSPQLIHSQMKAYRDSHDHNPTTLSRVATQSKVLYEQAGEASEPTAPHSTYTRRISAVTHSSSSTKGVPTYPTSSISSQNSKSQVPSPDTHSTTHLALNTVTSSASEFQHLGRRKHFRTRDDEEEKDEDTQRPAKRLRKQFPPPSTPQPSKKKRYLTPKPKTERIRRALQMPPKASTTSEDRQELRRDFPNHLPFSRPFQQDQADEEDEESPMIVHGYELERLQPQPLWTGGLRQNEFLVKGGFGWKMNEASLASPNESTNKQEIRPTLSRRADRPRATGPSTTPSIELISAFPSDETISPAVLAQLPERIRTIVTNMLTYPELADAHSHLDEYYQGTKPSQNLNRSEFNAVLTAAFASKNTPRQELQSTETTQESGSTTGSNAEPELIEHESHMIAEVDLSEQEQTLAERDVETETGDMLAQQQPQPQHIPQTPVPVAEKKPPQQSVGIWQAILTPFRSLGRFRSTRTLPKDISGTPAASTNSLEQPDFSPTTPSTGIPSTPTPAISGANRPRRPQTERKPRSRPILRTNDPQDGRKDGSQTERRVRFYDRPRPQYEAESPQPQKLPIQKRHLLTEDEIAELRKKQDLAELRQRRLRREQRLAQEQQAAEDGANTPSSMSSNVTRTGEKRKEHHPSPPTNTFVVPDDSSSDEDEDSEKLDASQERPFLAKSDDDDPHRIRYKGTMFQSMAHWGVGAEPEIDGLRSRNVFTEKTRTTHALQKPDELHCNPPQNNVSATSEADQKRKQELQRVREEGAASLRKSFQAQSTKTRISPFPFNYISSPFVIAFSSLPKHFTPEERSAYERERNGRPSILNLEKFYDGRSNRLCGIAKRKAMHEIAEQQRKQCESPEIQGSSESAGSVTDASRTEFSNKSADKLTNSVAEGPVEEPRSSVLQEKPWDQTPPKTPRPTNAQLPQQQQQPTQVSPVKAPQTSQKYQPSKPSRLREVSVMSPLQLEQDKENMSRTPCLRTLGFDTAVVANLDTIPEEKITPFPLPSWMQEQMQTSRNEVEEAVEKALSSLKEVSR